MQPNTKLTAISVSVPYLQFTDPNMENRFLEILTEEVKEETKEEIKEEVVKEEK